MNFSEFRDQIAKIQNLPLPGEQSHLAMAPLERIMELKKYAKARQNAKKAAVLLLFYPSPARETRFVLILRKSYKGVHSAQVAFPGGKMEEIDRDFKDTALRETEEEVGVEASTVEVLRDLTEVFIPPSNYFVQPYLGITEKYPSFVRQEDEVDAIIEVPLHEFMDDSVLISRNLTTSYATNIEVPAFYLQEHVVWGATAMMLSEVRTLLKQTF